MCNTGCQALIANAASTWFETQKDQYKNAWTETDQVVKPQSLEISMQPERAYGNTIFLTPYEHKRIHPEVGDRESNLCRESETEKTSILSSLTHATLSIPYHIWLPALLGLNSG